MGVQLESVNGTLVIKPGADAQQWERAFDVIGETPGFRLSTPSDDNSGFKWDGQIDVVKADVIGNSDVRNSIGHSMAYWTRQTRDAYLETVTDALQQARQANPGATPAQLIEAITTTANEQPGVAGTQEQPYQVLPPVQGVYQAFENADAIAKRMETFQQDERFAETPVNQTPRKLAETLMTAYPVAALPLQDGEYPIMFKSILSNPTLQRLLEAPSNPADHVGRRLRNGLSLVSGTDTHPLRSFEGILTNELQRAFKELSPDEQAALQSPLTQSIAMSRLGEDLYLYLLTGKTSKDTSEAILEGLYTKVPGNVLNSEPITGAYLVKGYLKKQLTKADTRAFLKQALQDAVHTRDENGQVTNRLLSADDTLLAQAVLENREYGLNWRLDAAKDFGDMDSVMTLPTGHQYERRFEQEFQKLTKAWNDVLAGDPANSVKSLYQKSVILGEMTDPIAGDGMIASRFKQVANVFDTMTNFNFVYNRFPTLVHHFRRYEPVDGEHDFDTARVMSDLYQSSEKMPEAVNRLAQQLVSTHDAESLSYTFLMNQGISDVDHLSYRGMKDALGDVLMELATKPSVQADRQLLDGVLGRDAGPKLQSVAASILPDQTEAGVKRTLNEWLQATKSLTPEQKTALSSMAMKMDPARPADLKLLFAEAATNPVNGLLDDLLLSEEGEAIGQAAYDQLKQTVIQPSMLGTVAHSVPTVEERLNSSDFWNDVYGQLAAQGVEADFEKVKQWVTVRSVLAARITESSNFRGVRAQLNNTLEGKDFKWNRVTKGTGFKPEAIKAALYTSLDKAKGVYGRHYGYQNQQQQLFRLLDDPRYFETALTGAASDSENVKQLEDNLRRELFSTMTLPILPKLLATYGMQTALPGQPSFNLVHDLAAQGGGDHLKNKFLQNRQFFPAHWLEDSKAYLATKDASKLPKYFTPEFAKAFVDYQDRVGELFNLRQRFPALTDGFMLRTYEFNQHHSGEGPDQHYLNDQGVIILPRANEEQTVITLVNTLKPKLTSWNSNRIGEESLYPYPDIQQPTVKNFSLDVSRLGFADGTKLRAYKNNNPAEGAAQTYTVKNGQVNGINFDSTLVLERVAS